MVDEYDGNYGKFWILLIINILFFVFKIVDNFLKNFFNRMLNNRGKF